MSEAHLDILHATNKNYRENKLSSSEFNETRKKLQEQCEALGHSFSPTFPGSAMHLCQYCCKCLITGPQFPDFNGIFKYE